MSQGSGRAPRTAGWTEGDFAAALGAWNEGIADDSHIDRMLQPLEKMVEQIRSSKNSLESTKQAVLNLFPDHEEVRHSQLGERNHSVSFLTAMYQSLAGAIILPIDNYLTIEKTFSAYLHDNLGVISVSDDLRQRTEKRTPITDLVRTRAALSVLDKAIHTFVYMKVELPQNLGAVCKNMIKFSEYLHHRFVKAEDHQADMMERMLRRFSEEEEETSRGDYVKVKLVDDSPLFTDFLLRLVEALPVKQERTVYETTEQGELKAQQRRVRVIPDYVVRSYGYDFLSLASNGLLRFLSEPYVLLNPLGEELQQVYAFFEQVQQYHEELVTLPMLRTNPQGEEILNRARQDKSRKTGRLINRIKNVYFGTIQQEEHDYTPDNRRENDHFALRQKLFGLLQGGLAEIASSKADDQEKEKRVREIITSAIELRTEIHDVLSTLTDRQLHKDKLSDNEYYEGRQGGMHGFHFEFDRKPTPTQKLDDVIGKSFDQSKEHLAEIIEAGRFPHLMRLSAPGHKVRSNMLLIGPYGCGKTELMRAACADPRLIGASVSVRNALTAYMHESVNNVGRIYDAAKKLFQEGREQKPVLLVLDEFDAWFARGHGTYNDKDMQQIELTLSEVLDGMGDYNGIITIAMTNEPLAVPPRIMRRFRYVDIIGELNLDERKSILKMYLERSVPVQAEIGDEQYTAWAERLEGAPGDVIRKVVDEIHFRYIREYLRGHTDKAEEIEKELYSRILEQGNIDYEKDGAYLRKKLAGFQQVTPSDVEAAVDKILKTPAVVMQINKAKKLYRESRRLLDEIADPSRPGFGLRPKQGLFGMDE